jgi:type IV pilus biogenesis protein CpaD/CtpE
MWTRWASICGLVLLTSSMTGCGADSDYVDPYKKPYAWYPTDAPTSNLAAQLVNPRDLVVGRGEREGDAKQSSLAVERVWQDRPKQISGAAGGAGASSGGSN